MSLARIEIPKGIWKEASLCIFIWKFILSEKQHFLGHNNVQSSGTHSKLQNSSEWMRLCDVIMDNFLK